MDAGTLLPGVGLGQSKCSVLLQHPLHKRRRCKDRSHQDGEEESIQEHQKLIKYLPVSHLVNLFSLNIPLEITGDDTKS